MNNSLDAELDYYISHQKELVKKYNGKYAVIIGNELVAVYDDYDEAVNETMKTHELGTFMVHQVGSGKENYTRVFNTRRVGCPTYA